MFGDRHDSPAKHGSLRLVRKHGRGSGTGIWIYSPPEVAASSGNLSIILLPSIEWTKKIKALLNPYSIKLRRKNIPPHRQSCAFQ
mmetsp:Transcript_24250/g.67184  ORF Transcript_24250/g.67184 Transcript_24250/m.67184 type:complete len:85 (+) Transcript_24250:246-500(+)